MCCRMKPHIQRSALRQRCCEQKLKRGMTFDSRVLGVRELVAGRLDRQKGPLKLLDDPRMSTSVYNE